MRANLCAKVDHADHVFFFKDKFFKINILLSWRFKYFIQNISYNSLVKRASGSNCMVSLQTLSAERGLGF